MARYSLNDRKFLPASNAEPGCLVEYNPVHGVSHLKSDPDCKSSPRMAGAETMSKVRRRRLLTVYISDAIRLTTLAAWLPLLIGKRAM